MTNDSADHGSPAGPPPGAPAGPGPVPPAAAPPAHGSGNSFFDGLRRSGVQRSSDRWVGGVAGGLAARFGVDPLLARGVIGVTMLMGFGLVLYGIAWALLPEQSDGRIHLEETIRGRFDVALLGAIGLVVLGLSTGDWWFGWGPFSIEWIRALAWIGVVAAGIVILVSALRRDKGERRDRPGWQPPTPAWQPPSSATTPPARPTAHASVHQEGPTPMTSTGPTGAPPTAAGSTPPAAWTAAPTPPPSRGWTPQPPPPPRPPHRSTQAQPPRPPKPPKPPRRGPGATITGVVVAIVLLGLAALLLAERAGVYDGPIASVVLGGGVLLVGLAIIVSGLRGRTAGGLTALAIVGIVLAGPTVAFTDDTRWVGWDRWEDVRDNGFGDVDAQVASRSEAEAGFSTGLGDLAVDLTDVPLTGETLRVPISGGMGNVQVVVPEGAAVVAEISAGGGTVTWDVDGRERTYDGLGTNRTLTSDAVTPGQDPAIELVVQLGLGDITIEED